MKCPHCLGKMREVEKKPNMRESQFFKRMGSDILSSHSDAWQICDSCFFVRHMTLVEGKPVMTSEYFSKEHAREIK